MRMYWHLWNLIFCEDKNSCHLLQLLFFSYMYLYLRLSTIKVMRRKCIACKFSWTIWWRSSLLGFFLHPLCLIFQAYVECLYVNHHLCENIIKKNKQNFVANSMKLYIKLYLTWNIHLFGVINLNLKISSLLLLQSMTCGWRDMNRVKSMKVLFQKKALFIRA